MRRCTKTKQNPITSAITKDVANLMIGNTHAFLQTGQDILIRQAIIWFQTIEVQAVLDPQCD